METVNEEASLKRVPTVGEVLMQTSREQAKRRENEEAQTSPQLPKKYETPRHKREELFDDIDDFLEERQVFFKGVDEAKMCGRPFMEKLTNVLWDIDNHQEMLNSFAERKHEVRPILSLLSKFTGYNDLVKKKKSTCTRLNRETLKKHGDCIVEQTREGIVHFMIQA